MTNLSVPPNVDEPLILKRFLQRLTSRVDKVIGNSDGDASHVTRAELNATLSIVLAEANTVVHPIYVGPADLAPIVDQATLMVLREPGAPAGSTSIIIREP